MLKVSTYWVFHVPNHRMFFATLVLQPLEMLHDVLPAAVGVQFKGHRGFIIEDDGTDPRLVSANLQSIHDVHGEVQDFAEATATHASRGIQDEDNVYLA